MAFSPVVFWLSAKPLEVARYHQKILLLFLFAVSNVTDRFHDVMKVNGSDLQVTYFFLLPGV